MQIWIHDKSMRKVCALNNNVPDMLPYSSSQWHTYLEYSTSTFDFTIPKIVNGKLHDDIKYINDQMFVSFYFDNSYHVFYVSQLVENDFNFQVTCNNTNLELAREVARPLADSGGAKSVEWYLRNLELLGFAGLEIGVNEISDRTRTLTFESQSGTKLEQLHSLMNQFDAEFIFRTELNRDGTMKRFIIDIYQEADKNHHGIGKVRGDVILYYQSGLKGVQVTSDKTQLFNAGVFTGANGVNLDSVEFEEKNELGQVEFYSRKGTSFVFAPLSRERYPSTMNPDSADNWTRKDFQTEYKDVESLKAYALRTIKQYAYPLLTYTVDVQSSFLDNYKDINLGDTVKIIDNNFRGGLALEARVSEMIISFDNPANNSVVFTNFKKLDNKPSDALQQRIDEIVSKSLPYHVEIRTTNGTVFKNGIGRSTVKPILKQGDKIVDATYRFVIDGTIKYVGMTYDMVASEINQPTTLTISAWVDNKEVASEEVTFVNVSDGKQGPKGDDGKTTYFHTAWSYSADGTDGFTTVYPNLNLLDGTRDFSGNWENGGEWTSDGTYKGLAVKKRVGQWAGIYKTFTAPKDGKYTFSAYVKSSGNAANIIRFVTLNGVDLYSSRRYFGNNFDWLRDSFTITLKAKDTIVARYEIAGSGTDSILWTAGHKWEEGSVATPWMPSASEVKTADYPSFIGHYTDFTQVDSPNPRDYTWSLIRGNDGKDGANGGENLIVNSAFPEDIDGWGFWDESTPNNNLHIATHGFYYNGTKPLFRLDNNTNGVVPASTKRFPVKRNTDYSLNIQIFATGNLKSVDIYFLGRKANETDKELTKVIHLKTHTGSPSTTQTVKWHLTFNSGDCDEGFIRINNNGTTDGKTSTLFFAELDCYEGTGDRAWQASSKDFEEEIDTKADDVLTQAQLNRLNETNSIIKAELNAKASLDTLNQWVEAYQNFVNANNANRAQAEKDLADASARVTKLENDLNDMSERWNFIDSYMAASNEGLVVGKKDKSSSIMFNPNGRISMFSAGNEVMYISKGVINIENGIFSKTIQIGRYREEQDLLNPDRNVIRYVGGA
ncbi:receptor binding protein [Streptococcus phage 128]|uniref:Receptor binding protein n=1 Tax=Streptococcus phage 128 TaxID=1718281 RepID=A0A1S5PRZ5_9CAUD|nr:virion structural protein [Streptococcus phage 128]ALJ99638.1 receptor binding protein [Streptococcus phage 128]AXF53724.1 receptor binding protein [Streptococcus phage 142]